jgi:hypothetical protein
MSSKHQPSFQLWTSRQCRSTDFGSAWLKVGRSPRRLPRCCEEQSLLDRNDLKANKVVLGPQGPQVAKGNKARQDLKGLKASETLLAELLQWQPKPACC